MTRLCVVAASFVAPICLAAFKEPETYRPPSTRRPLKGRNPLRFRPVTKQELVFAQVSTELAKSLDTTLQLSSVVSPVLPQGLPESILPRLRSLQLVLARLPKTVVIAEGYKTTYYVEKLACGHETLAFPQCDKLTAKRRNCITCANLTFASTTSPEAMEGAASPVPQPEAQPLPPKSTGRIILTDQEKSA